MTEITGVFHDIPILYINLAVPPIVIKVFLSKKGLEKALSSC
jgi:hypothetical protein